MELSGRRKAPEEVQLEHILAQAEKLKETQRVRAFSGQATN